LNGLRNVSNSRLFAFEAHGKHYKGLLVFFSMETEVGDILICNVDKISGTTVFVEIEGLAISGTIILSEIAAGRIRNLRDYVVPKKTIVCKVLRIHPDHLELSLRRVSQKERKEALEKRKLERSYEGILSAVFGKDAAKVAMEIKAKCSLVDFFENAKEDSSELVKVVGKEKAERVVEILKKQKKKVFFIKKEIRMFSFSPDGLKKIKKILDLKEVKISYVAAGKYVLTLESENPKQGEQTMNEFVGAIENQAKSEGFDFLTV